jgi:hypothetical protein
MKIMIMMMDMHMCGMGTTRVRKFFMHIIISGAMERTKHRAHFLSSSQRSADDTIRTAMDT